MNQANNPEYRNGRVDIAVEQCDDGGLLLEGLKIRSAAGVNDDDVGAGGAADADGVDEAFEDEATWLIGVEGFSVGRPFLSKKSSACLATCSAVSPSTSFPIISLMRGGIDLSTCSLRMWSISTSLTSSLRRRRY